MWDKSRIIHCKLESFIKQMRFKNDYIPSTTDSDKFPVQIPLGERAVGWKESDVDQWIEDRIKDAENTREAAA